MKEDFQKKLENLALPDIEIRDHKDKLKAALIRRQFPHHKANSLPVFKKSILALGMSFALLIAIFIQNNINTHEVANAQEIIEKAIATMQSVPNPDKKIEAIISALKEAQQSKNLEYLGEENFGNKQIKNVRFTDEDLLREIIIHVDLNDTSANAVSISFSTDDIETQNIEVKLKNNQILEPETLRTQLRDNSIQKEWMKTLIQHNNLESFDQGHFIKNKSLREALRPFVNSAEVIIPTYTLQENSQTHDVYYLSLSIYALGKQKENKALAQQYVDKAIVHLKNFSSPEAKNKLLLLEKAKKSKYLKYFPAQKNAPQPQMIKLSFVDEELRDKEIFIFLDLQKPSEEAVQFLAAGINASRIEGKFENGKLMLNPEAFKDQNLNKNTNKDLIIQGIIKSQNEQLYKDFAQDPQFPKDFLEQLHAIFQSSEFLIQSIPYYTKDSEGHIQDFTIAVQSFE